jgi:hypothetical protein
MNFMTICFLGAVGTSLACSGQSYRLKGEEVQPGVFNVLQASGSSQSPEQWTQIGVSYLNDFRAYFNRVITEHSLVFIGRIDSSIGPILSPPNRDTVVPGLVPDITLAPEFGFSAGFYVHLVVDTVLKGYLPSKRLWIKSYVQDNTCGLNSLLLRSRPVFLNFSNGLDSSQHLKISLNQTFCTNCPPAHWFDGQYLRSPAFPVLSLDIRDVLPGYPVSLRAGSAPRVRIPLRSSGEAYRPDGRIAPPEEASGRKAPRPLLK